MKILVKSVMWLFIAILAAVFLFGLYLRYGMDGAAIVLATIILICGMIWFIVWAATYDPK